MRNLLIFFAVVFSLGLPSVFAADTTAPEKDLRIIRVTPTGEDVASERQIVITFNRPVVPLGKMERDRTEIPVTFSPDVNCEWRWMNTTSLACQLGEETQLTRATKYNITINPGIKTEDGATIAEPYTATFITQRADVSYSSFKTWRSPGMPVIRLTFNQPITKKSVEKHLYIQETNGSRMDLTAKPDPDDREAPAFVPFDMGWLYFGRQEARKSDDQLTFVKSEEGRRIWLVEPEDELEFDSSVILKLEPGLVSASGPELSAANRDIVAFDTYPDFQILGIRCRTNSDVDLLIKPDESYGANLCNPMGAISIAFSTPVMRSQVKSNFEFTPAFGNPDEAWGDMSYEYSRRGYAHTKGNTYDISLPYGLKAAQEYTLTVKGNPSKLMAFFARIFHRPLTILEDEFGRRLTTPVTLTFATDHRKHNFVLDHHEAILEKSTDSEVPLYINNLEKMAFSYRSVTTAGAKDKQSSETSYPAVQDIQYAVPFGVRDILKGKPGAVYGNLQTTPAVVGKSAEEYRLFAQVTPYQMHVKLGHFSTLVWVTDMTSGAPVSDAKITLYKDTLASLSAPRDILGTAVTDKDGMATLPGSEKTDPKLALENGWGDTSPKLFIRAEKGEDMGVMPLNSDFVINTWRISNENIESNSKKQFGHIHTWGTTAQGIYRAGDTIQYKFYVRNQDDLTFVPAPSSGYKLEIIDPMGNVAETVENLQLNTFGAYAGEFKVAQQAPVGWYRFRLNNPLAGSTDEDNNGGEYDEDAGDYMKAGTWYPLRVLVSDFTPVPFKVTNQLNGDLFRTDQEISVESDAKLHSGGPYTDASNRTTAILNEVPFTSKNPAAVDFTFTLPDYRTHGSTQVFQKIEQLDAKGELATTFTIPKQSFAYGRLTVESAVQDDRGKYVAAESRADYVGVDRFVGMKSPEWIYEAKKPVNLKYIAVDEKGIPTDGTKVSINIEHLETTAVRIKGAGNAYLTNYTPEWKQAGTCEGTSEKSALTCSFTPDSAGSYRAIAKIGDTQGREHSSGLRFWVTGSDYVLWDNQSEVLLPIEPEKTSYQVGDTARYLVKNPYPGAKALITIERYGIIDKFVQTLEGSTPVIEFKVKPDYLPGFYMSVLVVSPRVEKPLEKGQVDLGKPTFRMGYVTVPVKDKYKEITITAKAEQDVYRPRDKVNVSLHAEPRMKDKKEPIEFAVAVLDEAVFDLVTGGKANFDPYNGFYTLDGLDLRNYNLLNRLIGRQLFEKKGANPGGDGGVDLKMRDLFKFVSYWNPSLKADGSGNASVSFEAPDNLTGWRILALAVTPSDRMGLGDANFKVNRPTEIRPVMPNQVTERDNFKAGFSVMNRTDKLRTLTVTIKASGLTDAPAYKETVKLDPYKRTTVYMPVQALKVPETRDEPQGEIKFEARAFDDVDSDGMVHAVPVHKMRSLETAANYGTTTDDKVSESIQFPDHIYPDIGGISVTLAPSVIGAVEGAFKYMRDYPYICWEQILTKGVMASHYLNLKQYMLENFEWKDSDKLPQAALDVAANFQTPSGGMSYFIAQDDYADPYLSAYTALSFNWLKQAGYKIPETVEGKLHGYLLNLLKNDAAPSFYDEGMRSTIRAVALAALAEHGKVTKADMERYRPHVPQMSLFGKTYFVQAALKVDGAAAMAKDVSNLILSASNQTGGKFIFNETLDDSYLRILSSPLRENCAILSTFTAYGKTKDGAYLVGDIPFKLVRTITQTRQNRDHWENTQENMFCMNALIDYSHAYETAKPDMTVTASLNSAPFGQTSFSDLRDKQEVLERPIEASDVGQKATVDIERKGDGRLYYATRLRYAPISDFSKPVNAGMTIRREYSVEKNGTWELLQNKDKISRGDIVRIDLYLSLPAARNFVAVNDPVPGGLEPLNRDLANTSKVDAYKGEFKAAGGSWFFKFSDWQGYNVSRWSFYHQELRHDSVRFYSDYLAPGNYHLSYTAQAIAEGEFTVMPTLAEEMYDPDVYGKDITGALSVTNASAP